MVKISNKKTLTLILIVTVLVVLGCGTIAYKISQTELFLIEIEFYPEMEIFIKSIGETEGGTDNKWWQYWVNGTLGETSADNKKIKGGDIIEWKFETLPF